jgi:hypothetical protein
VRVIALALGLLLLGLAAVARAEPVPVLTCRDWAQMPRELKASFVRGVIEGVGLAATTAVTRLPHAHPHAEDHTTMAERLARALVAERGVDAYVAEMTSLCRDGRLPAQAPLGIVFARATQTFERR